MTIPLKLVHINSINRTTVQHKIFQMLSQQLELFNVRATQMQMDYADCQNQRLDRISIAAMSVTEHVGSIWSSLKDNTVNVTVSVRGPDWWSILQLRWYEDLVCKCFDFHSTTSCVLVDVCMGVFAFLQIWLTCSLKLSAESIIMPQYLADSISIKVVLRMEYNDCIAFWFSASLRICLDWNISAKLLPISVIDLDYPVRCRSLVFIYLW